MAYTIPKVHHPSPSTRETAAQSQPGSLPHTPRLGLLNTVQAIEIDSLHAVTVQAPQGTWRLTVVWHPRWDPREGEDVREKQRSSDGRVDLLNNILPILVCSL